MFTPDEMPDVVMNHFYELKQESRPNNTYYIATDYPLPRKIMFARANINFIGIAYNKSKKIWSIDKSRYNINQELSGREFIPIEKSEFIYQYNRMLIALGSIEFE